MDTKDLLKNAREYGIPVIRDESHEQLVNIVKNAKPKHILEIGTAIGYSGIAMLSATNADLVTIEHNKEFIKLAKRNFKNAKLSKRVKIIQGDCMVELAKMVAQDSCQNKFDFIFLDGPKAQYDLMLENLIYLLAPSGTLVADNVLFHGYVKNELNMPTKRYKTISKRLNNFIENCKNNKKLMNFMLFAEDDGMIFVQKVKNED